MSCVPGKKINLFIPGKSVHENHRAMEERWPTHAEDPDDKKTVEKICGITGNSSNIRNIAVTAKVDHGRHTTIATLASQSGDYDQRLLSSN